MIVMNQLLVYCKYYRVRVYLTGYEKTINDK